MNIAKNRSETNGKKFLFDSCVLEKRVLESQLKFASESISHDGVKGGVAESHYLHYLRRYLPDRYKIDTGIVIDSNGATSDQIDIIIYDKQYTPCLMDQLSHKYIPAEAIYSIIEVKPTINKAYIEYADKKAQSVIDLKRTSCPIQHAGGEYPPKPNFPIVCGIIAAEIEWADGLNSDAFSSLLIQCQNLSFVHALNWGYCDTFNKHKTIMTGDASTMSLTFRLLKKLQALGTVPAIDWDEYSKIFDGLTS